MTLNELFEGMKKKIEPMNKDHKNSSPGQVSYPSAGHDPYKKYRLGVAAAGAPDNEHEFDAEGPASGLMVSSHYSSADEDIMKAAHKRVGYKMKKLAGKGSKETDPINSVSPVAQWNKTK